MPPSGTRHYRSRLQAPQYIAQKVMHPCRESVHAAVQILNHGGAMIGMAEDDAQLCADAFAILRQDVLQPVQRLHYAHCRSSNPVKLAGSSLPEHDDEIAEF